MSVTSLWRDRQRIAGLNVPLEERPPFAERAVEKANAPRQNVEGDVGSAQQRPTTFTAAREPSLQFFKVQSVLATNHQLAVEGTWRLERCWQPGY